MIEVAVLGTLLYLIADAVNAGLFNAKVYDRILDSNLKQEDIKKFRRIGPISALLKYQVTKDFPKISPLYK